MKYYIYVWVIIFLVVPMSVGAETETILYPIDRIERQCIAETTNTYEMNMCSKSAQNSWLQDISESLNQLKNVLKEQDYSVLLLSQSSWDVFKENEFSLITNLLQYNEGTMFQNVGEGWKTNILRQRAIALREYLSTIDENK